MIRLGSGDDAESLFFGLRARVIARVEALFAS